MSDPHTEPSRSTPLEITEADLNEIAGRLEQDGAPQELQELALHIVRARSEQGGDIDPAQPPEEILRSAGGQILGRLADALGSDPRFKGLESKWFLAGPSPERFENIGTSAHSRLPAVEQAEATQYAYDPETYEILCRPGQRLNEKKARRLQELKLYAHVVTFAE